MNKNVDSTTKVIVVVVGGGEGKVHPTLAFHLFTVSLLLEVFGDVS